MDFDFVEGSGRIVYFLHGWGGDKNSFAVMKTRASEINRNMFFVSFKGFGKSGEPDVPYSIFDYVNELLNHIIKFAKGKSVDIVCHSFGARVAVILASEYPFLVNKLVIVDGAGLKPKRKLSYFFKVAKFKRLKKKVQQGKVEKKVLDSFGSNDYRCLSGVMKRTFVLVVNTRTEKYAQKIKTQTLIIWGEKDDETPLFMAKKFKKLIKNSELFVMKNCGHFPFLDDFELFFSTIKKFLGFDECKKT